jgi:hypothetical protein
LIGKCTSNRLFNPPSPVSTELRASTWVKSFDPFHKANVSLANEVEKGKAKPRVVVGDLYHEAEVGTDHLLASRSIATFDAFPKALLIRTS